MLCKYTVDFSVSLVEVMACFNVCHYANRLLALCTLSQSYWFVARYILEIGKILVILSKFSKTAQILYPVQMYILTFQQFYFE